MKITLTTAFTLLAFQFAQAQNTSVTTTAPSPGLPIAVSLKTEISSNMEAAKQIGGALTETQFRMAYKFNEQAQLGLLLGAKYNLANETQIQDQQKMVASDVAIAGIYNAPSILGSDKTQIDGRLYLPSSDASRTAKQQYQLRADITLPYSMESQRSVAILLSPRFNDFEVASSKGEIVSQAKLAQGKTVAPYLALNHKLKLNNATAGMTRTEEYMGPELGIEILPHRLVKLSLLMSQERNILNPTEKKVRKDFALFDTNETKYLFGAQIKL